MFTNFKAQLSKPLCERRVSFSEPGWAALQNVKTKYQQHLQREISDSVCIDILLTGSHSAYAVRGGNSE